uniref:low affinity immunoglobulin gamma Fc region receptor II-like n=1 Tax=Epinephelus lanceolatus TaxID=310571 RepID=UPI001445C9F5|nr:low affinity immunoglobulin gamma Fc region receptor II-like [Epinephelus lanceolatus]
MRTLENIVPTNISNWVPSAGSGTISPAFSSDSGAYWCEAGDGLRSNSLSISITAGSVILETPVLPVMEGDTVTLSCKKKKTPDDLAADFYKDGLRIKTEYKGKMTLYNVSTSDEGLYKCHISGAGGSPESRLAVRGFKNVSGPEEKMDPPPTQPTSRPQSQPRNFHTLLWIVGTVLLVALLLLVLGVLYCRIHKGEGSTTRVPGSESSIDPHHATYAVVQKTRRGKVPGGDDVVDPHQATYAVVKKPKKEKAGKDLDDPHDATYSLLEWKQKGLTAGRKKEARTKPGENVVYSSINFTAGDVSNRPRKADAPD